MGGQEAQHGGHCWGGGVLRERAHRLCPGNDETQDRATGSTANETKVGGDGEDSLWGRLSEAQSSTTRQRNQGWEAAGKGRWAERSVAGGPVGSGPKTESPSQSPCSRLFGRAFSRRMAPSGLSHLGHG